MSRNACLFLTIFVHHGIYPPHDEMCIFVGFMKLLPLPLLPLLLIHLFTILPLICLHAFFSFLAQTYLGTIDRSEMETVILCKLKWMFGIKVSNYTVLLFLCPTCLLPFFTLPEKDRKGHVIHVGTICGISSSEGSLICGV